MNKRLSDIFSVKGRFRRSIHLERDFYTDENLLEGYVVTTTARDVLGRVISALENDNSSKVWSLTGPYGSGKSAFALFAANLLRNSEDALNLLQQGDPSLYQRFTDINGNSEYPSSGFCPILISGERAPISTSILKGLQQGLISYNGISKNSAPMTQIRSLLKAAQNGTVPQAYDITEVFESVTLQIKKHDGSGILLVIDELGKFLEYATQNPAQGDMFVLQTLAEFASRSKDKPLFLLTILHQAFEMYSQQIAGSQLEEWSKIQGRFEDVPFTEPIEQVLRLIGAALENSSNLNDNFILDSVDNLGLNTHQHNEGDLAQLLESCLPLHPTVALSIGPLFRRFAQNERSLFAFLSSGEPFGLQEFLSNQHYDGNVLPLYSLSDLYDYLNITHGNKLYTSVDSKKWGEIESALNRLPDPSETTVRLIKTIGLLGITGEVITNLKPSKELLHIALKDNSDSFIQEFDLALSVLENNSIITYRHYNNTYSIWEGSDIDITEELKVATSQISDTSDLISNLTRYIPTRPLVARRHLFETGTLRHFTIRYTNSEKFDADLNRPHDESDGLILYTLPTSEYEVNQLQDKVRQNAVTEKDSVLVAIPESVESLHKIVLHIARLHWIQQNNQELQMDSVARRELSARIAVAETDAERQIKAIFSKESNKICVWFHKGKRLNINSQRELNEHLSKTFKNIYGKSPIIKNELINRRKISGSVTAARRQLIQAMLEKGGEKDLGIIGFPPEMSIYRSLLLKSGIHRQRYGKWGFYRPNNAIDKNRVMPTWHKIEEFLTECELERQPVEALYKELINPPFGLRSGPLPILLCAAMLCYKREVALYEEDSFVPEFSMPVFERLLKAPERFELKRFQMTKLRSDVLKQYIDAILDKSERTSKLESPNLLAAATPLMIFISRLPKYTLITKSLSENAKKLRQVVLEAREPDTLLFHDLPVEFEFSPFDAELDTNCQITQFFQAFQNAFSELNQTYPSLLDFVKQHLVSNLLEYKGNELDSDFIRTELNHIAEPLKEVASGTQLIGFLMRICDRGLDFNSWLEAIATSVVNKSPVSWTDSDKTQFEIKFSQLTRQFRHFQTLSYEKLKDIESPKGELIRVGITRPNQSEQEWVVTMPITTERKMSEIEDVIKRAFDNINIDEDLDLRSAILARISQGWIQQKDKTDTKE